jgi:mannitol/fructose-specific phosphotransferase system IIA component (Ntr-type)
LRPDLVVRLDTTDQDAVFVDLVDRMATLLPKFPRDAVLNSLRTRERTFPSALGHGVAVPHTYCADLDFRLCAMAQIPDGVDFGALDGQLVRLVFLLISPADDAEGHMETMAEIARLTSHAEMRDQLLAAEVPDGVLSLVRDSATVL